MINSPHMSSRGSETFSEAGPFSGSHQSTWNSWFIEPEEEETELSPLLLLLLPVMKMGDILLLPLGVPQESIVNCKCWF